MAVEARLHSASALYPFTHRPQYSFHTPFCVGDKFFLKNNMILCQMDYEEGQLNGSFETQVQ
ncbi:hypothetical protein JZ751_020808 [Albula glossodonta]|uniref:Uncharacterized protein n=1 Tax=Albula glossodonta TaxID=121402 RepID=A0A8T2PIR5_9TELE|nr:hypothetical protein JZ751_020808 [Albula glossodonta]